jgi:hypothetical protein
VVSRKPTNVEAHSRKTRSGRLYEFKNGPIRTDIHKPKNYHRKEAPDTDRQNKMLRIK